MHQNDEKFTSSNPLRDDMAANMSAAEVLYDEYGNNLANKVLNSLLTKVPCLGDRINDLKSSRAGKKRLLELAVEGVTASADGNLTVRNFNLDQKKGHTIWLFDGYRWLKLGQQKFIDFLKEALKRMGLSTEEYNEPAFMRECVDRTAYIVCHACDNNIPKNDVWINLLNGTLEIKRDGTTCFREHKKEDNFNYVLPYVYDENAECPMFHKFLDQMMPEKEMQIILAEYICYCFTRGLKLEKMLVLFGDGANGKSVVLSVVEGLFGSENVSNVSLSDLTNDDEKRSLVENKLANISYENGKDVNHSTLKTMVSGERVVVRELYRGSHETDHYAKLIASYNILPLSEKTYGYYRRFLMMPMEVTISEDDADPDLPDKLKTELPGILNWALSHFSALLQRRKFTFSPKADKALHDYMRNSDSVALFIDECCDGKTTMTTDGPKVLSTYQKYCKDGGLKALGRQNFYKRLETLGIKRVDYQHNTRFQVVIDYENDKPF